MRTAVYIAALALALLACRSPLGPTGATPIDPPVWIVENYRSVAECLEVDARPVRWHVVEYLTHPDHGSRHLGMYYRPDRIYLDRRVLDHPDTWWAEHAVRHEAIHALTGNMEHEGTGWECGPSVPESW